MTAFYLWSSEAILALIMLSVFCVILQASAVVASFWRYKTSAIYWAENLAELGILLYMLLSGFLIARISFNMKLVLFLPTEYVVARYFAFAFIAILAILVALLRDKPISLTIVPAAAMTLPFAEQLVGVGFPWVYILMLFFWMGRAIYICALRRRELQREVSAFSIKAAMDALHTGLLYCGMSGKIYLTNRKMQELMQGLTGKIWRNGVDFRNALRDGKALVQPEPTALDEGIVYRLPSGAAWLFKLRELEISGKQYIQISAVDVSSRWALTQDLWAREEELRQRGEELTATLERLDEIQREEALLRLKSKVHDTMAQRLTVLMQVFRAEKNIAETQLINYADDMLAEVRETDGSNANADSMEALCRLYGDIGVTVEIHGSPPEEAARAAFCLDFIREGIVNAVRHGFATKVVVRFTDECGAPAITVTNNGFAPAEELMEGGGITELRRKLALLDGRLEIASAPQFAVSAHF